MTNRPKTIAQIIPCRYACGASPSYGYEVEALWDMIEDAAQTKSPARGSPGGA